MLRRAVGQPKTNGFAVGPPPRGAKSARPSPREIQKLGEMATAMLACLRKLKEELDSSGSPRGSKKELPLLASVPATVEAASTQGLVLPPVVDFEPSNQNQLSAAYPSSPVAQQPSPLAQFGTASDQKVQNQVERQHSVADTASVASSAGAPGTEAPSRNSIVTEQSTASSDATVERRIGSFELEGAIAQLNKRVEELEAPAAKAGELEKVVKQLRARVTELEAREARVAELRTECGSLRMRIAELVAATVDCKSLEEDRTKLLNTISKLESLDAPEVTGSLQT